VNNILNCGSRGLSRLFLLLLPMSGFLFLCANPAYATTVTRTPTVAADCTNVTGIGTRIWSNPSRAISSNNSYASKSVDGTTTNYLRCLNYGFTIPATATINGITVNVERKSNRTTNGGSHDAAMRIVKGGVIGTTDRSTATLYTTGDVTEAHGSAADLWGLSWTAADINAATFGAAFAAIKPDPTGNSHTISVDVISITVDYTLDITPPTVSSISLANGSPTGAASVAWTVVFSESVTGVDSADFSLVQAGGVSGASITSVSGSGTTWTVNANTGSGSGTLGLNLTDNDTILDLASNKLGGTGAGNGNFTGQVYAIDKLNPTVNSINRANSDPTVASSVSWTVVFSESVTGVDTGDFSLVQAGGVSGASITSVSGSGTTWTVTANTGSGSGTLRLDLVDNDTITDATSHPLGGAGAGNGNFTTGQFYTLDRTSPSVSSINRADSNPSTADAVSWTVTFSESVTGMDTGDFALAASGLTGAYVASVTGSGTTWTVVANTGICSSVCTLGLNLVDDDTIIDGVGNKLGGTGAGNGNFTGQVYSIGSTSPIASYSMDEASWNSTADEVTDSEGDYPGTAFNSATTKSGDTGTCRYGVFDNGGTITKGGILLASTNFSAFPDMTDDFTITAWIRTTDNTAAGQRIFIDDEQNTANGPNVSGYGLSLGDGGTGMLRFYARGSSVITLDTSNVIANNTWYFVAGVADITNGQRYIYVFNAAGALVTSTSVASTGWGIDDGDASIGAETNASTEAPASFHFKGNLDEVRVYGKVLNQAALTALATTTHACASAAPNHYELSLPTGGITCLSSTVTVTACTDSSSPCSNNYTAASGTTATLVTSAGTLGATTVTFGATGVANTTLSYPAAVNGAAAAVTLSGEQIVATSPRKCCPDGINCVVGNSCSATFNTAGFIISGTVDDVAATIPSQVAGTTSATYYLRAIKTNTTTKACESALSGANTVNFAYECNDPTTCYAANLMSVNGGSATTIARNNNGSHASVTAVNMTFDANGNAPFTFNYSDVGQVKLWASKTVNSAPLSGSTNGFVVKPFDFRVIACDAAVVGDCTTAPADPGVAGGGSVFAKAGTNFKATVTARTSGGTATPSFGAGSNNGTETVNLTRTRVAPTAAGVVDGTLGGTTSIIRSSFSGGIATVSDLSWSEVGVITLTAANSTFLGNALVTTGVTGNLGRFYPDHFDTSVALTAGVPMACPAGLTCPTSYNGIVYSGQAYTTQVTAMNLSGGTTQNYSGALGYAKAVTLAAWDALGSTTTQNPSGALANNTITTAMFGASVAGVATTNISTYTLATATTVPTNIFMRANESLGGDNVTSLLAIPANSVEGGVKVVSGHIKVSNAYGSELLPLTLMATAQYYTATGWVNSITDSITHLTLTTTYPVGAGTTAVTLTPASSNLSGGQLNIKLGKPSSGAGIATITPTAPPYLPVTAGTATFGVHKGNNRFIYRRENY